MLRRSLYSILERDKRFSKVQIYIHNAKKTRLCKVPREKVAKPVYGGMYVDTLSLPPFIKNFGLVIAHNICNITQTREIKRC